MKNLCMMMALSVLLVSACSNDGVSKKDYDQLVQENANLKALLTGGDKIVMAHLLDTVLKKHIDSLETIKKIKIPVSLTFEKEYLYKMLSQLNTNKDSADGLLGYPMYERGYLKIALVPYYLDGNKIKLLGGGNSGAYNFSDICPSPQASQGNACADNAGDVFGTESITYDFEKCER